MSIIHWCWRAFWDILKLLVVWSTGAQALWTAGKVHHQKQKKWFAKFFERGLKGPGWAQSVICSAVHGPSSPCRSIESDVAQSRGFDGQI